MRYSRRRLSVAPALALCAGFALASWIGPRPGGQQPAAADLVVCRNPAEATFQTIVVGDVASAACPLATMRGPWEPMRI